MVHFSYPGSGVVHDCIHSYLCPFSYRTTNFPRLLNHASFIRSADDALLTQKITIKKCVMYLFQINLISLKINLISENSVYPDEMLHNVEFHLGLQCLPKYAFRSH